MEEQKYKNIEIDPNEKLPGEKSDNNVYKL